MGDQGDGDNHLPGFPPELPPDRFKAKSFLDRLPSNRGVLVIVAAVNAFYLIGDLALRGLSLYPSLGEAKCGVGINTTDTVLLMIQAGISHL